MPSVYLAIPTYNHQLHAMILPAVLQASPKGFLTSVDVGAYSATTLQCNRIWLRALEARKSGVSHFLMLHSDVVPRTLAWLDILLEEMNGVNADILSVVSLIKNDSGDTSTAMESDNLYTPKNLTLNDISKRPETFTDDKLLVNTGCMLVNITKPWVNKIFFHSTDDISDGVARFIPEDWNFSRDAKELGASIYSTRKIVLQHWGPAPYINR